MKPKIRSLLADMNTGLIDREHAIKAAVLSVLAAENLVLIGPPGTAKSMVARRVAQHIQTDTSPEGANGYFEYLLTKFSTPEEIFGPLSITELKADRFRRNTAGYLPTAQVAFLDEIFKASSSILNALLTILNERIFHNGNLPQRVPLRSLIAASNELPTGQEELSALYDRFLVRAFVGPVRDDLRHRLFDTPAAPHQATERLTEHDLQAVDAAAQQVSIPPAVGEAIRGIWAAHQEAFKEDRRESLSDRRLVKLLKLLRVSAATNDRTEVDLSDAALLQHCLWNHPDNIGKVREIVITTLKSHSGLVPVDEDGTDADGVYVVGGDGRQLVQQTRGHPQKPSSATGHTLAVQPQHLPATPSRALSATAAMPATRTQTKGFAGSGTAQDPIRIGSAEDLVSMDDPDVSLAGYHFVQTADIDCAAISHWPEFAFKGHYNGNGKTIRLGKVRNVFSALQATSSVIHLRLEGCGLANGVTNSRIEHCHAEGAGLLGNASDKTQITGCQVTGGWLVGNTANTVITDCQVTGGGLVGHVDNSQITRCQVMDGQSLVLGQASNTQISDCGVVAQWSGGEVNKHQGLIAAHLTTSSVVERCYVTGAFSQPNVDIYFGSIVGACNSSAIRQCAVGPLKTFLRFSNQRKRIVPLIPSATLQNNASIDTNPGDDDPDGTDGKTVAAARFNQRFFESSLGWDFDTVWQWDATHNRPTLRPNTGAAANLAATGAAPTATNGVPLEDLLTRQVQANIWL